MELGHNRGNDPQPDAEERIRRELNNGETFLWAGRPLSGIRWSLVDLYFVPFGLLFSAGALAFMLQESSAIRFFPLPHLLVGLYFAFGRKWVDVRSRSQTFFGLTDQRAIVVRGLSRERVSSTQLKNVTYFKHRKRRDGSGLISFGNSRLDFTMAKQGAGMQWPIMGKYTDHVFNLVPNMQEVISIARPYIPSST